MFEFIDNYPVLAFVIMVSGIVAFFYSKFMIDCKLGENSQAYYKVLAVLKKLIPAEEQYIPVYAYWEYSGKYISSGKYYAVGITDNKLYIVPLYIAGDVIGYNRSFVITRDNLGKIDSGKPGGSMRFVFLYDKNQKEIFRFMINEKNTKLNKANPVNIVQIEEYHAFFVKLNEWEKLLQC